MRSFFCSILFTLAAACSSLAQTYSFRYYTKDNGLPNSYIYAIDQAKNGPLNLSTGDGFYSFDGQNFNALKGKNTLSENFVTTHFTDSRGITWLGYLQEGLSCISNARHNKINYEAIKGYRVTQFIEYPSKRLLVATLGGGIFTIDSSFHIQPLNKEGIQSVNTIAANGNEVLAGSNEGLFICTDKSCEPCGIPELRDVKIKKIIPAAYISQAYWVATEGSGLYCIRKKSREYVVLRKITDELQSKEKKISDIYYDADHNLWLTLFGEGIRRFTFLNANPAAITECLIIDETNGLPNNYIQTIFQDYEGNMWFGTFGGGLIEKPVETFSFYKNRDGAGKENVFAILSDREQNLWIGSDLGLSVNTFLRGKQSIRFGKQNGFVKDEVHCLLQDMEGLIWVGTNTSGIYIYDPVNKKFRNFSREYQLPVWPVNCMLQAKDGGIVIGTQEGAHFYDPKKKAVKTVTTLEGLLHNDVLGLFEDSKHRIWFCSHQAPPYYLHDSEFTVFKDIPGLDSYNINSATEDSHGNIWIASEGDGVFVFNDNIFVNYTEKHGLLSNYCYSITTDINKSVWISHKNGLSEKREAYRNFYTHTKADGLNFTENNLNAFSRDADNNIWFGTPEGIVRYNPANSSDRTTEPRLEIAGVYLNNVFYKAGEKIVKRFDKYNTRIEFTGISLTDPAKVMYKYRLLGVDSIWQMTNNRFVEYPRLTDGVYVFQVMARNSEGRWTSNPAELRFEILLPYWKRLWFYVLLMLMVVAIASLFIYFRTRNLRRTKAYLELKVKQKTFLLQREKENVEKIKGELEIKNKDITDSINYAKRIQKALMPNKRFILNRLPQTFIFFRPRDIVSGDFYWFAETENDYIIAAVDCTGHGVPGAFMSLIGSTLLNEIVNTRQITSPARILTELNSKIVETLKQERAAFSSYDGMDMAICTINKKKTRCLFASAYRPLYFVRNGELREIKGNSYSIGGKNIMGEKVFDEHEVTLEKNDMLYIFSDGYGDQFSEVNHKKFTTRRLKTLLTLVSEHDVQQQRERIKENFEYWKGKEEQVDDVLIIGIRI
jgi:ligand-binding sensor domain-containing protein/serine phosphatase RsbU (regulator of sigma subunit)